MKNILNNIYLKYLLFGALLITLPFLQSQGLINSSTLIILATVLFYSIVGLGLNVLLGYSGLVSLGTAGFMGLGAYLSAYFTVDMGWDFLAAALVAILVSTSIGFIIGLISLRIEGFYLAIATLGVSEIFKRIFETVDAFSGGFTGKRASYPKMLGMQLDKNSTFILMVIVLVALMIFTYNFIHSRTGRSLLTMRSSEAAAQAMGINILKYKVTAFCIATGYAAIGGVLYVHFIRFSYPSSWNLLLSLQIIAVIVIGGLRTISGPVIGSFIVFGVPELVLKRLPIIGEIDGLAYIFNGILIIVIILFYPNGLVHMVHDIKRLFKRKNTVLKGGE